ncbi:MULTISPECIES: hypothetical protein [Rodentibacter]|uniref:hypothetical protein n=1 Tax=Rodentibacter TaxID=1960084 RepID=UPI001CFE7777|nr:hypothetical protein [Rodentibacter sp. JRC1]GJI55878.1 hypothetical protein HEMROJRC1_09900 [Rodentibacter sp. JRC1]
MNVDHKCTNCGGNSIRVRTSEKIGMLLVNVLGICNNCGAELSISSQIIRVRTPTYNERPEALKVNKPLKQIDERQLEIATD